MVDEIYDKWAASKMGIDSTGQVGQVMFNLFQDIQILCLGGGDDPLWIKGVWTPGCHGCTGEHGKGDEEGQY